MFIVYKLDRHKSSSSDSMDKAVSDLLQLMELDTDTDVSPRPDHLKDLKYHIKVILCNLINAYQTGEEIWIGFMGKNGWYEKHHKEKEGFRLSSTYVNKITKFLTNNGYIEKKPGYKGSKKWKAQDSKMRFTGKIFELIPDLYGIEVFSDPTHLKRIKMKGVKDPKTKKRKPAKIPTKDKAKAKKLDANVLKINSVLCKTKIELDNCLDDLSAMNLKLSSDPDKYVNPIDFTNKNRKYSG